MSAAARALQDQLSDLDPRIESRTPVPVASGGQVGRQVHFNVPSGRTSEEEEENTFLSGIQTPSRRPAHVEFSDEALARVPSYSTARRSQINILDNALPVRSILFPFKVFIGVMRHVLGAACPKDMFLDLTLIRDWKC